MEQGVRVLKKWSVTLLSFLSMGCGPLLSLLSLQMHRMRWKLRYNISLSRIPLSHELLFMVNITVRSSVVEMFNGSVVKFISLDVVVIISHYMSFTWSFYPKRLTISAFNIHERPFRGSASCPRTLRHGLGFEPPTFWLEVNCSKSEYINNAAFKGKQSTHRE